MPDYSTSPRAQQRKIIMITLPEIRAARRQHVIDLLTNDVARLKAAGKMDHAILIGSYFFGDFDSGSDIDLVCVVEDSDKTSISSADFVISSEKDIDLIFISKDRLPFAQSWAKEGVRL